MFTSHNRQGAFVLENFVLQGNAVGALKQHKLLYKTQGMYNKVCIIPLKYENKYVELWGQNTLVPYGEKFLAAV